MTTARLMAVQTTVKASFTLSDARSIPAPKYTAMKIASTARTSPTSTNASRLTVIPPDPGLDASTLNQDHTADYQGSAEEADQRQRMDWEPDQAVLVEHQRGDHLPGHDRRNESGSA
jgi:hypothetical protein